MCLAAAGAPLAEVVRVAEEQIAAIRRRVLIAHFHCVLERQFARALSGLTRGPGSLADDAFDEERDLAPICRTNNAVQVGFYHLCHLKLHYYRGEMREALASAARAEAVRPSFQGTPGEIDLVFFRGLAQAALAAEGEEGERAAHLEGARSQGATLTRWAADCPANFEHKARLLEAEIARAEGRDAEAAGAYAEAARSADAFGFVQHAALAWELLGGHHARTGDDTEAEAAFRQAVTHYRDWGASTLANRLQVSQAGVSGV
jgi:tetratricopeptide (TPR) repeat protein